MTQRRRDAEVQRIASYLSAPLRLCDSLSQLCELAQDSRTFPLW